MIKNFNEWYIDVNIAPQEGQIEKRVECIINYAQSVNAVDVCNLVNLYYGLPISDEYSEKFSSVFIEKDPSFSTRYIEELSLLAGATLLEISSKNSEYNSLAEILTLTTSFYRKPSSTSRALDQITKQFNNDRINIRERSFGNEIIEFDQTKSEDLIANINITSWNSTIAQNLTAVLTEYMTRLNTLTNQLNTMQDMQSVYKEDSQLLWWMMSNWSTTLNQPLKEIDKIRGCLIIAYEAACFISNYPGPYSMEGIIRRVIDACKGKVQSAEFTTLITQVDPKLKQIIKLKAKSFPVLEQLPITYAILCADNATSINEWYPKYCRVVFEDESIIKNTFDNYAWQMYLECLALFCYEALSKQGE